VTTEEENKENNNEKARKRVCEEEQSKETASEQAGVAAMLLDLCPRFRSRMGHRLGLLSVPPDKWPDSYLDYRKKASLIDD
jgi:hypothetical protein